VILSISDPGRLCPIIRLESLRSQQPIASGEISKNVHDLSTLPNRSDRSGNRQPTAVSAQALILKHTHLRPRFTAERPGSQTLPKDPRGSSPQRNADPAVEFHLRARLIPGVPRMQFAFLCNFFYLQMTAKCDLPTWAFAADIHHRGSPDLHIPKDRAAWAARFSVILSKYFDFLRFRSILTHWSRRTYLLEINPVVANVKYIDGCPTRGGQVYRMDVTVGGYFKHLQ